MDPNVAGQAIIEGIRRCNARIEALAFPLAEAAKEPAVLSRPCPRAAATQSASTNRKYGTKNKSAV